MATNSVVIPLYHVTGPYPFILTFHSLFYISIPSHHTSHLPWTYVETQNMEALQKSGIDDDIQSLVLIDPLPHLSILDQVIMSISASHHFLQFKEVCKYQLFPGYPQFGWPCPLLHVLGRYSSQWPLPTGWSPLGRTPIENLGLVRPEGIKHEILTCALFYTSLSCSTSPTTNSWGMRFMPRAQLIHPLCLFGFGCLDTPLRTAWALHILALATGSSSGCMSWANSFLQLHPEALS